MKKRKTGRIIGIAAAVLVLVLGGILAYIVIVLPNIPVPQVVIKNDSSNVAHGKYLANHVMVCIDCHSQRDWTKFSGPVIPGSEGRGGEKFDQSMGFPGVFYAKNITPFNLDDWTDGEIYRAVTSGVTKDRGIIFPVMPYLNYGKLAPEDISDVIAYIRTLQTLKYDVPESKADFPMNIIMHTIPEKPSPVIKDENNQVKYGEYLVTSGACFDCHTIFNNGKYDKSKAFAGGREFQFPSGIVRSANITPDKTTGIGSYTDETFINRFKAYDETKNQLAGVGNKEFNSIMPWSMYAGMDEKDLKAIHSYLASLSPIQNQVERFTPFK